MSAPLFFKPQWPVPANVKALVTTRSGGVSKAPYDTLNLALHVGDVAADVLENRRLLAQALATPLQWQWLDQVHSNTVRRVHSPQDGLVADALITSAPGLACCILTADCLSVFFAAADGSEVAIAHAGWRGLAAGILANTLRGMHSPPAQVSVWLGPAIGPCHFEVGPEVRAAFLENGPDATSVATAVCFQAVPGTPKYMADLFGLARLQLGALGVRQISGGGECTVCLPEKYYSFRRAPATGRQLSLIYLQPGA